MPTILDVVCLTTGMGFAAVARVTEDRWVACSVRDNIAFGLQPGGELQVDTTICHEIRQHGDPVIINHVAEHPVYRDHATPRLYGFQSYISMPITLPDGRFFGTLCAIDPRPHRLDTQAVIGTFKLFAELIAFHLEAGRTLAASETSLLREREIADVREQFIAVLGHDLRNPLAAVSAGTRLLLRHPERAVELGEQIRRSIGRMARLIENVMDFARGRLGDGLAVARETNPPIEATLRHVVEEMTSTHSDRAVNLRLTLNEPVSCDPQRIGQLLSNLLGNALTHGDAAAPVQVVVQADAGMFELSVVNRGAAIPPDAMGRLFQPFVRGEARSNQEGLGLGLFIASEIAKAHGGKLTVTSTRDETVFTFRMATQ